MITSPSRAALVIIAVIIGSALAGAAVDHAIVLRNPRRFQPSYLVEGTEAAASRRTDMLERLTEELSLRPEQRAAIDSIMRRTDSVLRGVRLEMQPRVQTALDDSRRQIENHLDATQRASFNARQPARHWRIPQ
jgi:molecular chaperone DnaK (HSP70)